jgi:hypothetical protein
MEKAATKDYIDKLVSINKEINFLYNFEKFNARSFFIEEEFYFIYFYINFKKYAQTRKRMLS